jgi:hypothetical protein
MASSWTGEGPVSTPPRSLAYGAAIILAVLAVVGMGLGFRAAFRQASAPGLDADAVNAAAGEGVITAAPIVDLPAPVAAIPENDKTADTKADAQDAESLAAKTAAAQAIQSKAAKPAGDIDDILASPTEKPPPPVKAAPDEAPPNAPVKSDVPF